MKKLLNDEIFLKMVLAVVAGNILVTLLLAALRIVAVLSLELMGTVFSRVNVSAPFGNSLFPVATIAGGILAAVIFLRLIRRTSAR